jgi:hypothetical protein
MNRREFMALTAAGFASYALGPGSGNAGRDQSQKMEIKAVAFDAFRSLIQGRSSPWQRNFSPVMVPR